MKYNYVIRELDAGTALDMVRKYHYSDTVPGCTEIFTGFYLDGRLVGMITLGWGTDPRGIIHALWDELDTKDYWEIGRMCMTEDMPRNSESQMISALCKWIKVNFPQKKVLFTWADGMLGKVGYVYQACSFYYAGYSDTDIYLRNGIKYHHKGMNRFFKREEGDTRRCLTFTYEEFTSLGFEHYKGKQLKYLHFLCGKTEKKHLMKTCKYRLTQDYPKEDFLKWKKQTGQGKWQECGKPPYTTDKKTGGATGEQLFLF